MAKDIESEYPTHHPMQPVLLEGKVLRFKRNKIVEFLLDNGGYNMNKLARMDFSVEDREQFAQLIGYSVDGFAELPYASAEVIALADAEGEKRIKAEGE